MWNEDTKVPEAETLTYPWKALEPLMEKKRMTCLHAAKTSARASPFPDWVTQMPCRTVRILLSQGL